MTAETHRSPGTEIPLHGQALLHHPILNQGPAFSMEDRRALGLEGLLPPAVSTLELEARRAYEAITRKTDPLEQYIGLIAIQDRNETLFYRLLLDHIEEFLPVVYTPTVGLACQTFSHIFRRARGLWITPDHRGRIDEILGHAPSSEVKLIVVTDNERILGLGDLGAGGIGIPIGKLSLYTLGAGIHPRHTLPISLDVGTDNQELLADEFYLGWRQPRLRGRPYDELVDEFVDAVRQRFPDALLQWEDFKKHNAFTLLDRYRDTLPSFNDDIQGTGAVTLAAALGAIRMSGQAMAKQRFVLLGAGAAGIGIARQLADCLRREGLAGEALTRAILLIDSVGLVHEGRELDEATKHEFAWPVELARSERLPLEHAHDLERIIEVIKPTVLIGTSGVPGAFSEPIVRAMARYVERPVILPLSNPDSKAEATPQDLIDWTEGRAIVATGSPFPPVTWQGRTLPISQANNVLIFPGVGLGALVARASKVTDGMFTAAARTLAEVLGADDLASGRILPPLERLRPVTRAIAQAVAKQAADDGVGESFSQAELSQRLTDAIWQPRYAQLAAEKAPVG